MPLLKRKKINFSLPLTLLVTFIAIANIIQIIFSFNLIPQKNTTATKQPIPTVDDIDNVETLKLEKEGK